MMSLMEAFLISLAGIVCLGVPLVFIEGGIHYSSPFLIFLGVAWAFGAGYIGGFWSGTVSSTEQDITTEEELDE